jgi:hypothetical protein
MKIRGPAKRIQSIISTGLFLSIVGSHGRAGAQASAVQATSYTPRSIPTGHYTCNTLLSGFSTGSSTGMTLGSMRVLGPGTYTALTKEKTGAQAAFTYDPGTGVIIWEGGKLQGFFGKVQSSKVFLTSRGVPGIGVVYRVREGGNLMNLDCERDGN